MKPLIERICEGPYSVYANRQKGYTVNAKHGFPVADAPVAEGLTEQDAAAHAELILEAFTVAHETGLTPRQMAERITQANEALRLIQAFITDLGDSNPGFLGKLCLQDYGQMNEAYIAMDRYVAEIPPAKP